MRAIMFELVLLSLGTLLAVSLIFAAIRPLKAGDPFYVWKAAITLGGVVGVGNPPAEPGLPDDQQLEFPMGGWRPLLQRYKRLPVLAILENFARVEPVEPAM